jgi:predicted nucleic acid-binding protein
MVLAGTPVWIRFLTDRAPQAAELERLLGQREVVAHDLVCGELLVGDIGGRKKLFAAYGRLRRAATVPHADVITGLNFGRLTLVCKHSLEN